MAKLPTDEFRQWFERLTDQLSPKFRTEVAEGRQIPPTLLVFSPKGQHAVVPAEMATPEDKEATFYAMKTMAARTDMVEYVVLFTEAWTVRQDKQPDETVEQMRDKYRGKSLEHVEGRREVVMATAISHGMQLMATAVISRDKGLSIMGPFDHEKLSQLTGRMALDGE